jgi:type I restriction enzyme S subunit
MHYPIDLETLPVGWEKGYVGDFALKIQPGFASGKHNKEGRGIPHIRPYNIDRSGKIDLLEIKSVDPDAGTKRLHSGDVLFNNTNSPELIGKTTVITAAGDWGFSNHMTRVAFSDTVSPKFAAYQLHYLWSRGYFLHNCVKHVNQASVSSTTLARAVPFVKPPRSQQDGIVAEIEKQFSRLDEAVANLKCVKANLKRYKASVLKAAVEGELAPTAEPWKQVVLGNVTTSIRNGYSKKPDAEHGTRIFRISAVRPMKLDANDVRYLSGTPADYEPFLVEPGDILFTRYNGNRDYAGVCARVPANLPPTVYPDKLIRVRVPRLMILPEFLVILASTGRAREYIESKIRTTAGQSGISGGDLKVLPLDIPQVVEQEQIVGEVERRLSVIEALESSVEASLTRADRLRQAILQRAFSGRLLSEKGHADCSDSHMLLLAAEAVPPYGVQS